VQAIHHDGTVMLHTRSSKYGLLTQGRVVRVPAELVRRQRHHFQKLETVGVDIILGCNGLVWVTHHVIEEQQQQGQEEQQRNDGENLKKKRPAPTAEQRHAVARVAQSVVALGQLGLVLQGNAISRVVELSLERNIEPKLILEREFLSEIAAEEERLRHEGEEADMETT
jgi:exosome complex component RRP4